MSHAQGEGARKGLGDKAAQYQSEQKCPAPTKGPTPKVLIDAAFP
jgi:hypothetical protein